MADIVIPYADIEPILSRDLLSQLDREMFVSVKLCPLRIEGHTLTSACAQLVRHGHHLLAVGLRAAIRQILCQSRPEVIPPYYSPN